MARPKPKQFDADKHHQIIAKLDENMPEKAFEARFVEDPGSFDPQANRPKWDTVIFETPGNTLDIQTSETPSNLLDKVAPRQSFDELASFISEIANSEWVWLDVSLGSVFLKNQEVTRPDTWDAGQLWNKALSIWEPWFR